MAGDFDIPRATCKRLNTVCSLYAKHGNNNSLPLEQPHSLGFYCEDRSASTFVYKSENCAGNSSPLGIILDKRVPFTFLRSHFCGNYCLINYILNELRVFIFCRCTLPRCALASQTLFSFSFLFTVMSFCGLSKDIGNEAVCRSGFTPGFHFEIRQSLVVYHIESAGITLQTFIIVVLYELFPLNQDRCVTLAG